MYFAVEQLRNNSGTHYDPNIVDAFLQTYRGKKLEEMQSIGLGE